MVKVSGEEEAGERFAGAVAVAAGAEGTKAPGALGAPGLLRFLLPVLYGPCHLKSAAPRTGDYFSSHQNKRQLHVQSLIFYIQVLNNNLGNGCFMLTVTK